MAFKMTMWILALMFAATIYNVVGAYAALDEVNVQERFETIGLIEYSNPHGYIIPAHKPVPPPDDVETADDAANIKVVASAD